MSKQNQYGLSRKLPAGVARQVRQNSKFGCVVCRSAFYQYEHIDPEFAEAREHNPDHICLLCGGCHDKVTRGHLSKSTVAGHYAATRTGKVDPPFGELDLQAQSLVIKAGSNTFEAPRVVIEIDGTRMFYVEAPEPGSNFPLLTGTFHDETGNEILSIERNEWNGPLDFWDTEIVGSIITIRSAPRQIALQIEVQPPNGFKIRRLRTCLGSCHVFVNDDLYIGRHDCDPPMTIGVGNFRARGPTVCMRIDTRQPCTGPAGLDMIGGQGVQLKGTGIGLGIGAPQMWIGEVKVWCR